MAESHQEVVKVWIEPGCIVCDACETDCPEVFEVQEETCIVRPEAQNSEFTKPLTPSVIVAAEGCPVDVIKFDTIAIEGPEPWAGKEEEEAAVAARSPAGATTAKKPAAVIPEGPPSPKWAGLLTASHTSGSRSDTSYPPWATGRGLYHWYGGHASRIRHWCVEYRNRAHLARPAHFHSGNHPSDPP